MQEDHGYFVSCWKLSVLNKEKNHLLPFNLKHLKRALNEHCWGIRHNQILLIGIIQLAANNSQRIIMPIRMSIIKKMR